MPFTHDTQMSLLAMASLVNTAAEGSDSGEDEMRSQEQLDAFVEAHRYSGSRTRDEAELAELRDVRPRLRALWTAGEEGAVQQVNTLLREHRALPQLVRHDGWDWHVHAVSEDSPLAQRIAVESALAVVDLIRQSELSRLRECEGEGCGAVLVDLSRNRSKRYCDVGNCANRAHVAAYRARRSSGGG